MALKLVVVTAFWGRPAVSRLYWLGLARLRRMAAFEVVALCSPEDPRNRDIAMDAGAHVRLVPNLPLAAKHNAGLRAARDLGADYVLRLDSDDLIGSAAFAWYLQIMACGAPYAGVLDCYFLDTAARQTSYWPGYTDAARCGHPIGTGRLVSAEVLGGLGWSLWRVRRGKHRGLDGTMDDRMRGIPCTALRLAGSRRLVLDVKSGQNLWTAAQVNGQPVEADELLRAELGTAELEMVAELEMLAGLRSARPGVAP